MPLFKIPNPTSIFQPQEKDRSKSIAKQNMHQKGRMRSIGNSTGGRNSVGDLLQDAFPALKLLHAIRSIKK